MNEIDYTDNLPLINLMERMMDYKNTLMWKEICETPDVLSSIRTINEDVMRSLVQTIKNGKATNFVAAARGTSDHALTYFKYILEVMSNYTVGLSAPSVVTLYKGKINYSNSIVIGCSQSGQAKDVLEVMQKANNQGAVTIAVTNNSESPIAKEAKFHLYCNAGEEKSVTATKTFNAQLYILLWLACELTENKDNLMFLRHIDKEIAHVFPEIDDLTTKYVPMFKDMEKGFILSRGLTYAIALESAHKFQETCYIQMDGASGSEFAHGSVTMVSEKTPIILYCAKNEFDPETQNNIRADQMKTINQMLSYNAPVLLVTNDFILKGKFKRCNDALINFNVPEEFAIFAFAVFAQMLACKLSSARGINPDCPRALNKIVE